MLLSVCLGEQDTPGFQSRDTGMAPLVLDLPGTLPWELWTGGTQPLPCPGAVQGTTLSTSPAQNPQGVPGMQRGVTLHHPCDLGDAPSRERVGRSLSPEQIQLMDTGENQGGWQEILDEEGRKGC